MSNETIETLKTRRAVRSYTDKPVDHETLARIAEVASYAPTGMGAQSPTIVMIEDKETRDKVSAINAGIMGRDMDPFYGAPALALVFGDKDIAPTWFEDACLVSGNLMNAAHAEGVDSCFVWRARQVFETDEGKALMAQWGIPDSCIAIANIPLGYGEGPAPEPKPRKDGYVRFV